MNHFNEFAPTVTLDVGAIKFTQVDTRVQASKRAHRFRLLALQVPRTEVHDKRQQKSYRNLTLVAVYQVFFLLHFNECVLIFFFLFKQKEKVFFGMSTIVDKWKGGDNLVLVDGVSCIAAKHVGRPEDMV